MIVNVGNEVKMYPVHPFSPTDPALFTNITLHSANISQTFNTNYTIPVQGGLFKSCIIHLFYLDNPTWEVIVLTESLYND